MTSKVRFRRLLEELVQGLPHVDAQVLHGAEYLRPEPEPGLYSFNVAFRPCHGLKM